MNPRFAIFAAVGVATDLLCLLGVAAVLLTNNLWLMQVGAARFWFVVLLVGIGVVPMMYARECLAINRQYGNAPTGRPKKLPAWAGIERSVRADQAPA